MESLFEQTNLIRQKGRRWRKIRNIVFMVLFFGFFIWGGISYYFPFATGTKTGKLYHLVPEGKVFKAYEGKLIQTESSCSDNGDEQSNEFIFSVAKKSIAVKLMYTGGKTIELHYSQYFKAIPWRGYSRYVVDGIVNISEDKEEYNIEDAVREFISNYEL